METETEVNRVEVEVPDGVTPVSLYKAVGGNLVLENQGRGWKENLVGAEPVERFRYVRDDEDARTGFDLLSDWFEDLRSEFDVGGSVDAGVFGYVGYDVAKETED
ncbi:MAG: hypothetical protein SV760_06490, partial [Halobacteria archaeon]|nr:hypothetical protein [Halobacteria archaeon]